jgi:hypothetical protein
MVVNSVVDRHRFDADHDPTFHFDDNPDSDPDPTRSYAHVEHYIFMLFIHGSPV